MRRFLSIIYYFVLSLSFIFALGTKESFIDERYDYILNSESFLKDLCTHPDFLNIKKYYIYEHGRGLHLEIELTNDRSIGFSYIESSGGGTFAGVSSIGVYDFLNSSVYRYDNSQKWEKIYGKHSSYTYIDSNSQEWRSMLSGYVASFANLSMLLGIKIETMIDAIDNYDKIIELAQTLAREQYLGNFKGIPNHGDFSNIFDTELQKKLPHSFANSENRKGVVYVLTIENKTMNVWDEEIPEDRLKKYLGLE